MFAAKNELLTRPSAVAGYEISRSLRFNIADTAYLNRTPASATNQSTWTFSTWIKRNTLDNIQTILSAGNPTSGNYLVALFFFNDNLDLAVYNSSGTVAYRITSTALYRDVSAWYHVMAVVDTTQATSSNRLKLYINGSQITAFSTSSYPPQNDIFNVNATVPHFIGTYSYNTSVNNISCNQTETYLIDGQALTPSSFGSTNAQTGVWGPKAYSGSYGTNGFYLNFSDNSNTTAATLGKDYSGNGNNWTPNNFSVTAGVDNDSLVDVPTPYGVDTGVGGEVRGNYAVLNPLVKPYGTVTFSNGNLQGVSDANWDAILATINVTSGKWYWEYVTSNINAQNGIMSMPQDFVTINPQVNTGTILYMGDGTKRIDGAVTAYGASYGGSDTIGVALDVDGGTITFYKNNTSQGSINLSSSSSMVGKIIAPAFVQYGNTITSNFGQRAFTYTAPSGFKALCTQNLPTPTIGATTATQASQFFTPVLYTGNGYPTAGTQSITTVGFQPDWVWIKKRSASSSNTLTDVVRGVNSQLFTDQTAAQETNTDAVTAFTSTGFNLGSGTTGVYPSVNSNGATYVAWNWKANGSGSSNTAGSVTSTVSANTTAGFSVVTWTGSSAGQTVGHGLGVAPSLIITKTRSASGENWPVYHKDLGIGSILFLNTTGSVNTTYPTYWGSSAPSSTIFGTFTGGYPAGNNYGSMVAYCFAPIAGYSSMGSYTGNGSTDGPFVFTGFRPAYVMVKRTDANGDWRVWDTTRETYNVMSTPLYPNDSGAEASSSVNNFDILSNGFKVRNATAAINANGGAYIFMAFASNPFKYSLARQDSICSH